MAKAYFYMCPFCNGESLSNTKTGQIDHRSVCGNKFYVRRVAARVALERLAEGFETLSGACSCESCVGKACGKLQELPWKRLRKGLTGLRGLRAGKR